MLDFRLLKFSLDKGNCSFNKETEEFSVELGFQIRYLFNDKLIERKIPKEVYKFKSDYKSGYKYTAIKPISLSTYAERVYLDDSDFILGYIEFVYNDKFNYISCTPRLTLPTYSDFDFEIIKQGDFAEGTNAIYGSAVKRQSNLARLYKEREFGIEKPDTSDFSTVIQSGTFLFEPLSGRIVDIVYSRFDEKNLLAEKGFYFPEGIFSKSERTRLNLILPESSEEDIVIQDLYFGNNYTWPKNISEYSDNLSLEGGSCPYTIKFVLSQTIVNGISILIPLSEESEGIFPFFFVTRSYYTDKQHLGYLKIKGSKVIESGVVEDRDKIFTRPQNIELKPVLTRDSQGPIETLYLLNLFNYVDKDYTAHLYLDSFYLGSIGESQSLKGSEAYLGVMLPLIGLPDLNYSESFLPKGEKPLILRNFMFLLGFKGQSPAFYFKEPEEYSKYFEDISYIINIITCPTRVFYTSQSEEKFLALHQSERYSIFTYKVEASRLLFATCYSEKDIRTLVLKFKGLPYATAISNDGRHYEIFYDSDTGNFALSEINEKGNDTIIQDGKEYLLKISENGNLYAEEVGTTDKGDSHPKIRGKEEDSKTYELWIDENGNLVAEEVE